MNLIRILNSSLLIILMLNISYSLQITEIMYNPAGSDIGREWVELYNNESSSINISRYKFIEENSNHNINLIFGDFILNSNESAIIADDSTKFMIDYPNYTQKLFDSSFSLINSGEYIAIKNDNDSIIFEFTYNTSLGAYNNGKSLSYINYTWQEFSASPGYQISSTLMITNNNTQTNNSLNVTNNIPINISINLTNATNTTVPNNSTNITSLNYTNALKIVQYMTNPITNKTYSKLFKIVNEGNGDYYNLTIKYNVKKQNLVIKKSNFSKDKIHSYSYANTGEINFEDIGNYTLCANITNYTYINDNFKCTQNTCFENNFDNNICFDIDVINAKDLMCNYSIKIVTEKEYFVNERIRYKFDVEYNDDECSDLFYINYQVSSNFLNNKSTLINSTTSSTAYKSYTPQTNENDQIYLIEARIISFANDVNLSDNYAKEYALYFKNNTNNLNVYIPNESGIMGSNYNYTIDSDYHKIKTNDLAVFINGSIDSEYLDIYVKKSTRYQSNKNHIEIAKNNYFSTISFINLDYLCQSNNINYYYTNSNLLSSKYNFSKYYYFYEKDNNIENVSVYVKGDNFEVIKNIQINKTQFCYLRYNSETIDKINQINPVFNTQYYMCNDNEVIKYKDKICVEEKKTFNVNLEYYNERITTNDESIPIKFKIESNKDYKLTFDFEFFKSAKTKEQVKINSVKVCTNNNCVSKCTNSKDCTFEIKKNLNYYVYFDIDLSKIVYDNKKSLYEIQAHYIKDNQKTIHTMDIPLIVQNQLNSSKINQNEIDLKTTKQNSDFNNTNITKNKNTKIISIYQDTTTKLKDPIVDSILGTISTLLFLAKLIK